MGERRASEGERGQYMAYLDGVPRWRACAHECWVEVNRVVTEQMMVQQSWCPGCGARRQVVTSAA